jgi:hypothetical protein
MRFAVALALALYGAASATPLFPAARAQRPPTPRDTLPQDTIPGDTVSADSLAGRSVPVHPWWGPLVLPGGVALALVLVSAPAPLARWLGSPGPSEIALLEDHQAVSVSVGGRFARGETWANAVAVEVVRNGFRGELQAADFWGQRHVRYLTVRVGHLWHPMRRTAGGVTVGYEQADGNQAHSGPELGLPFYLGSSNMTMRFEPTYVFSTGGPLWSFRGQLEGCLPGGRHFIGANVVRKAVPLTSSDRGGAQAVSVVVGTRF